MTAQITVRPAVLRKSDACAFVGLSKSTFEELVQKDQVPKPRKLSTGCVGWLVRELEAWVESRPVSDLLPPENTGAPKPRRSSAQTAA